MNPQVSESLTVLLVEDNPTDVFIIKEVVESCGLNLSVHTARDGLDALVYLRELARDEKSVSPVLVLLDLNLPRVAGIDVLRELRDSPRWKAMPVIIVTSSLAEEDCDAARSLGAQAYFQKPIELAAYMQLAEVIKRVFRAAERPIGT